MPTADTCDAYGRFLVRLEEMRQSLRIVEQCLDRLEPGPVMVEDKKIAWPAQLALGPDGMGNSLDHIKKIMGTSMEALIHHFKLVTEGFRVPAGQVYAAVESPRGELGVHVGQRRRHPALPGPLPRPVVHQPAGHGGDVRGRPGRRRHRRRGVHRPRDGRRRPMTECLGIPQMPAPDYPAEVRARLEADAREVIARYPDSSCALLPLLHLVQSEEGYVTRTGIRFCAEVLDLTTAEVTAVATFYSMYRRKPSGDYQVGVCTNTLCAVMGGDAIFDELKQHLGVGNGETTEDGKVTLEHIECNAACDFAPVVMVNWEFFDNQTARLRQAAGRRPHRRPRGRARPAAPRCAPTRRPPHPGRLPRRAPGRGRGRPAVRAPPRWPDCGWTGARPRPRVVARAASPRDDAPDAPRRRRRAPQLARRAAADVRVRPGPPGRTGQPRRGVTGPEDERGMTEPAREAARPRALGLLGRPGSWTLDTYRRHEGYEGLTRPSRWRRTT